MFLKWAGGKRRLLQEILPLIQKNIKTYYEPFLGGGAVAFALPKGTAFQIVCSDLNKELVLCYNAVKESPQKVACELEKMVEKQAMDEDFYYSVRNLDRMDTFDGIRPYIRAARFIFINRLGYNGLWRVNRKGWCNVPFGHRKFSFDFSLLDEAAQKLKSFKIYATDYAKTIKDAGEGDFVYFDPPYFGTFTSYIPGGFPESEQKRLRDECDKLTERGAKFLLSNSSATDMHKLWDKYNIRTVSLFRGIGCKNRGPGEEILVSNY